MKNIIITILEATVPTAQWETLKRTYEEKASPAPDAIINSYLAQDQSEPTRWRIVTLWRDQTSLDHMRNSGTTPTGVLIFQSVGANPTLSVLTVRQALQN